MSRIIAMWYLAETSFPSSPSPTTERVNCLQATPIFLRNPSCPTPTEGLNFAI